MSDDVISANKLIDDYELLARGVLTPTPWRTMMPSRLALAEPPLSIVGRTIDASLGSNVYPLYRMCRYSRLRAFDGHLSPLILARSAPA